MTIAARMVVLLALAVGLATAPVSFSGQSKYTALAADPKPVSGPKALDLTVKIEGTSYRLSGIMVRPKGEGPFPLAIINHGSCGPDCGRRMPPNYYQDQAKAFAERGYAAYALMRRGHGGSDGPYSESFGGCGVQDYRRYAERVASDIRAAIRKLADLPYVDGKTVVAIGHAGGGLGVLALSDQDVPGLKATINFAGGRGYLCHEGGRFANDKMIRAVEFFGIRSQVPSLWVYAANVRHITPDYDPRPWHRAYVRAGGRAFFVRLPHRGENGHFLFAQRTKIPVWTPAVDKFLRQHDLPHGQRN